MRKRSGKRDDAKSALRNLYSGKPNITLYLDSDQRRANEERRTIQIKNSIRETRGKKKIAEWLSIFVKDSTHFRRSTIASEITRQTRVLL